MATQQKYKNIRRIENVEANSYGWWVRVRIDGELFSKFFSDNAFNGSGNALRNALEYRDSIKRERGRPHIETVDPEVHYKGISRIDREIKRTHGWYVRVFYKGQQRVKFFSDMLYDGREGALAAALDFRDEAERELGKPRTDRPVVTVSRRNATGKIGVTRVRRKDRNRKGEVYLRDVYEITWCPRPNEIHRTSVSVRKYGEEEARKRAFMIRDNKEREIFGKVVSQTPTAEELAILDGGDIAE